MAEDIKENAMTELQSVDWIRGLLGSDSGRISTLDFISSLNIISTNNIILLDDSMDMNNLRTCLFWGYVENGLPANCPSSRFMGISMLIGGHAFQIVIDTNSGTLFSRGSYNSGNTWSSWV